MMEAWSRKRGWTKSQTVRAALRALTASAEDDPLLAAAGLISGLPADLSANFNRRLEETFVAAPQAKGLQVGQPPIGSISRAAALQLRILV